MGRLSSIAIGIYYAALWSTLVPRAAAVLPSGVFFPLFIDPKDDCSGWPDSIGFGSGLVPFFVAINPADGPGGSPGSQPASKFQTCIPTLNRSTSSVPGTTFTMGYVNTKHGKRASKKVLQDIDTYAEWNAPYRPMGIYFDKTPSDAASAGLIGQYAQHVRDRFGVGSIVSLNPGTLPSPEYFVFSDHIVTVNTFFTSFSTSNLTVSDQTPAAKQVVILHDQPRPVDFGQMETLVDALSGIVRVHGMLITNSTKREEFTTIPANLGELTGDLIGSQTA
ncbi:Spherulation-specific family 4 [Mycena pura]|uniref:Spherulation-specific family 4 n=1 Tax=Mycena pura TaxID=153505 RepID=A0AAD6V445_9AGAR|nr:Spherulation-specific family 4 [Mycena pura]